MYVRTHTSPPLAILVGVYLSFAQSQLPMDVVTPAVDAAIRQQRARMVGSLREGNDACRETRTYLCVYLSDEAPRKKFIGVCAYISS